MKNKMTWRCNVPELLRETLENISPEGQHGVLQKPFQIMFSLFAELSEIAQEIDDPKLNCMMIRLGFYQGSLPSDPEYKEVEAYLKKHYNPKEKQKDG